MIVNITKSLYMATLVLFVSRNYRKMPTLNREGLVRGGLAVENELAMSLTKRLARHGLKRGVQLDRIPVDSSGVFW